jgi:hypothetical protein
MKTNESHAVQIADALARCAPLAELSEERKALWLLVESLVCTKAQRTVTPLGSKTPVVVTADYASQELVAAMEWVIDHEQFARAMHPLDLYRKMRSEATKGMHGSGRAALADALHGFTHVPAGDPLRFSTLDSEEPVAS